MIRRSLKALLAATVGSACHASEPPRAPRHHEGGHHEGGHQHGFSDPEEASRRLDDPTRDEWQKPDAVIEALALTPTMTVADIGAGTGYFSVRLAKAVPEGRVFATDIEPALLRHLEDRARREGITNITTVASTPTASGLAAESVHRILVVHVWHHLADRAAFARDLATVLQPGGKLVIVEFTRSSHRGPPLEHRIAPEALIKELSRAGLSAHVSPISLPDQYILVASHPLLE